MNTYQSTAKYSEIITEDVIQKWTDNVILDGGTGTGKTHFILNTFTKYCVKNNQNILYLVSRDALKEQINSEIDLLGLSDNIIVANYQELEYYIKKEDVELEVDFIVCDEWHYVLETYNKFTDVSYEWIANHKAIKIFMSATCKELFKAYISDKKALDISVPKSNYYHIPKSYDYANVVFYKKKEQVELIIKDKLDNTTDKIIYFANSLKHAMKVYKQFSDVATFYCSKHTSNTEALELRNIHINDISNETFKSRLLITTSALDVGFNFIDSDIKHIITNIYDINSLTQCLGRKRLADKYDKCTFYIREFHAGMMNGKYNKCEELKLLKLFINNREIYMRDYKMKRTFDSEFIYFDTNTKDLKLNQMGYISILLYQNQREKYLKSTYKDVIIKELGLTNVSEYEEELNSKEICNLETYLNSMVGNVMLTAVDRTELIEKINVRDCNNNRLIKGIDTLNAYLNEINSSYVIKKFETKRVNNGKIKKYKQAWKVLRLSEY